MPLSNTQINIIDRENDNMAPINVTTESGSCAVMLSGSDNIPQYAYQLANRVCGRINSVEMKTYLAHNTYIKFHRLGYEPTPIIMPSLQSRTVTVNLRDPYSSNVMPTKMTAYKGKNIVSKPIEQSVMISMVTEKYDGECDGVVTEMSLHQEAQEVLKQLDREIATKLMESLEKQDSMGQKYFTTVTMPTLSVGSIMSNFESIETAFYDAQRSMQQFGTHSDDFFVVLSPALYAITERAARRSGIPDVEEFMGATVFQFFTTDDEAQKTMYVMPKSLVAASFCEHEDGTVIKANVTRNGAKQSTLIEFNGVIDLLCAGFTQVVGEGADTNVLDVKLPLITKVVFTGNNPS